MIFVGSFGNFIVLLGHKFTLFKRKVLFNLKLSRMRITNDEEILQAIVKKAWRDSIFKNDLIERPVQTIESFLGRSINLPEGKSLSVVDQTDSTTIFINLPAEPDMEDMELNEEQLDYVSGGAEGDPPILIKPNNSSGDIFTGP